MSLLSQKEGKVVIAHRGGSLRGPENTLEAMFLGLEDGADAIELDVQLAADGEVVVIHDDTVDRTTDGTGTVASMTLAELLELDAGFRFARSGPHPRPARSWRIPTLREVFESFPDTPIIIELKTVGVSLRAREEIEKHGAEERCLVDSFHADALDVFRASRIPYGASRKGAVRLLAQAIMPGGRFLPIEPAALCTPRSYRGVPLPVKSLAKLLERKGKPTHVWTVNQAAEAKKLWRLGVTGIITDDVRAIVAARGEMNE